MTVAKFDWTLIYTLITALISTLVTLGIVLWNLSAWKTRLILQIQQNKQDIDNLGNSIRKKIDRENKYQNIQIDHMARFLEETTQYRHPTIGGYDDEPSSNKRRY